MKIKQGILSLFAAAALLFPAGITLADKHKRPKPTREEKLSRELDELDRRTREASQYAGRQPAVLQEISPLLAQAAELEQEARRNLAAGESYIADRLKDAAEELLEATEHLANARFKLLWDDGKVRTPKSDEHTRRDAAKELERAYFRTAELRFLTRQAGADRMSKLAELGRRLYQEGRAAFDRQEFFVARQLASASRDLSSAVEQYLQAQLPEDLPPPPKVPKE